MLEINVVDKNKIYEQSNTSKYAWFFFVPREEEQPVVSKSYVVKKIDFTGRDYIEAGRESDNEVILIFDTGSIELYTIGFYKVICNDGVVLDNVDNLTAAKEWIDSGKALFSLGVAKVYIDSVNYVVTMYVPSHYAVRVGNLEAFVVL